jgi:hypothetical protein
MGVEAKIVVGFTVKEWRDKDITALVSEWEDEDYPSEDIFKVLEMDDENMSFIVPHHYDESDEDVVIGFEVLDVYGSAEELNFTDVMKKTMEVQEEFKERFGFEGKVYFGGHYDD